MTTNGNIAPCWLVLSGSVHDTMQNGDDVSDSGVEALDLRDTEQIHVMSLNTIRAAIWHHFGSIMMNNFIDMLCRAVLPFLCIFPSVPSALQ